MSRTTRSAGLRLPARTACLDRTGFDGLPALARDVEELAKIANEAPMYFEVTCFGGKEINFEARIGVIEGECETGFGSSWGVDPTWLQPCTGNMFTLVPVDDWDTDVWFQPRWAPEVDTSLADDPRIPRADWPIVEVTGH